MIDEIIMRILGWCPGPVAAAEFHEKKGREKVAGLTGLLGVWLLGYWYFTDTATGLYGAEKLFFVNRGNLLLLLGCLIITVYTWKQFKPSDWELPEFIHNSLTINDLPDIPVNASASWGAGQRFYTPDGVDPQWGGKRYKVVGNRETDIDWYRDKIEYYRNLKEQKLVEEEKPVPPRPSNKTPITRMLLVLVLVIGSAFGYSYMFLGPENIQAEATAFDRLSGFEIIVDPDASDWVLTGELNELTELNQFISIAKHQNVEIIYYVKQGEFDVPCFWFNSPLYNMTYVITLNHIS